MATASDQPLARELLDRHLTARATTSWAWAEAAGLDGAIVHALTQGEHPCAAPQLQRIGRALPCSFEIWARAVAAGICRCPQAALTQSVRGRLWLWLITRGLDLDAGAHACGVPRRSLALLARGGRVSARIRASRLPAVLGLDPADPLLTAVGGGCLELRTLLADGRRRHPHTVQDLAEQLGVAARTLRMLLRGVLPPLFNPTVVPALARRLGVEPQRLVDALMRAWQSALGGPGPRPGPPTLATLVMRHCLSQAVGPEQLAVQLGCSAGQVRSWLRGRLPRAALREQLRRCLGCAPPAWAEACRAQAGLRSQSAPRAAAGAPPGAPTLVQLISSCAAAQGLDRLRWALQAGISGGVLARLLRDGQAPRREEVRALLMRALGIDRPAYDRAVASLCAERRRAPRQEPALRTALQEQLRGRLQDGTTTILQLAHASGVGRSTIERVVRHGGTDLRLAVREKLRAYLGLESSAFQRQLEPLDAERLDDDEELRLVRSFRQAGSAARAALLEQALRLAARPSSPALLDDGDGDGDGQQHG